MTTDEMSLVAFAACHALRVAAFCPQMLMLARTPGAAHGFCFATWTLFAAANASTAVYAGSALGDVVLAGVHALSALCCGALIGLAWWRRHHPVGTVGSALR